MTLNVAYQIMPDRLGWIFQNLLICWGHTSKPSLQFAENDREKRSYPVSGSSLSRKYLFNARSQRRMTWSCFVNRKATVTQINSRYYQGIQKRIYEYTAHQIGCQKKRCLVWWVSSSAVAFFSVSLGVSLIALYSAVNASILKYIYILLYI